VVIIISPRQKMKVSLVWKKTKMKGTHGVTWKYKLIRKDRIRIQALIGTHNGYRETKIKYKFSTKNKKVYSKMSEKWVAKVAGDPTHRYLMTLAEAKAWVKRRMDE
jgi:hypothetical protein